MTREQLAEMADKMGIKNLAGALRDPKNIAACEDIKKYGWIRCSTDLPTNGKHVLVTDGKEVWIGSYYSAGWSVVYDGAPPFDSTEIKAWIFMPDVFELEGLF